jgi:hypothetical protein
LGILLIVATILAVALLAVFVASRSRRAVDDLVRLRQMAPDARVDQYERTSSMASEQIEEMVRRRLEQYPDLADTVFDFGTMADGTVDVWVNSKQYDDPEDIPDERIRKAIQEAVEEFNR